MTFPTTVSSTSTGGTINWWIYFLEAPHPNYFPKIYLCVLLRIGRSGRFGRKGVAINFVKNDDIRILR